MKQIICILGLLLAVVGCKSKPSYDIAHLSLISEQKGEIVLRSYAQQNKDAIQKAQILAIETILFRGIPNSAYNLPLVENRAEALANHAKYFNHLLNEGYYKTFIISSSNVEALKDAKNDKLMILNIGINYHALRRDLEQNGVIRKFGY